jgi:hypothetical protein
MEEPSSAVPGASRALAAIVLVGSAVSVSLGVYGAVHTPTGRSLTTLGFPTLLEMKAWLTTGALGLGAVQLVTALRMYERIGHGHGPRSVALLHRLSGAVAVTLTLPVAFHCLWSLGFGTYSARVLVHSLLGCLLYGAFVAKMLALRSRRVPGWAVPWLGGLVLTTLVALWLTSSLWFFTQGSPGY